MKKQIKKKLSEYGYDERIIEKIINLYTSK
jgi:hypothetical protein